MILSTRIRIAAAALLAVCSAFAQPVAPAAAQPARGGRGMFGPPPGPPSPQIQTDNRVTLNLHAPDAAKVVLNGDWPEGSGVPMIRNAEGVWSVTVDPLRPEIWAYTYSVDGVRTIDPRNADVRRDGARYDSMLPIAGPDSALYGNNEVPHGTVSMV